MAERPLGLVIHFRHGARAGGQIKEGIVSETVTAARSREDAAFDCALRGQQTGAIPGGSQHTLIACTAIALRDASELLQEEEIVVAIGVGIRVEAGISGVARGANARSALERVDLQSGIVRQYDFTGQKPAVIDRLLPGNGFESGRVFRRGLNSGEARQGKYEVSWAAAATAKSRSLPGLVLAT